MKFDKRFFIGVVDATLLALAGLKRLGMKDLIEKSEIIPMDTMLPAVSQGAIGIQCRLNDERIYKYLAPLTDIETEKKVECERAFLATLDGNCRTPIAGQAIFLDNNHLHFKGLIGMCDGTEILSVSKSETNCQSVEDAVRLGIEAGKSLIEKAGPTKLKKFQDSMNNNVNEQ